MSILPGDFSQVCWVVPDLQAAMQHWVHTANVGPFFCIRSPDVGHYVYRGQPGTLDMDVGLAQAGSIQIELIQPKGVGPSAYHDTFANGEQGMHHLGKVTGTYDADFARYNGMGFAVAHSGYAGDARFAYFDTRATLGFMVELIERDPGLESMFRMVADAATDWDGSDPFREITAPAASAG